MECMPWDVVNSLVTVFIVFFFFNFEDVLERTTGVKHGFPHHSEETALDPL